MPTFTIDPDIAKAKTPDTGLYTDPQLYQQIKEKLFAPSWQFIGGRSQALPGDALCLLHGAEFCLLANSIYKVITGLNLLHWHNGPCRIVYFSQQRYQSVGPRSMADGRAEQEASVRDDGVNHVGPVLATQKRSRSPYDCE